MKIILSILLGSLTGLVTALISACIIKLIFKHIKKSPIHKSPVVFTPQISPKALQQSLTTVTQHPITTSGKYFKTLLENGLVLAVKKLDIAHSQSQRRIQHELQTLSGLTHVNIMTLKAYVPQVDRYFLVYEYIPTGSLEDVVNSREELLFGWDARLRIAVGIIKALYYLHFSCCPRMLHYNLKPSNVLLDGEFEPMLSDCGLAKVFDGTPRSSQEHHYYYAPEYFPSFSIYTEKSDIFSFGVILGILLTGRDPSDPLFVSGRGGMGMWFRQLVEAGDGREALDKSLLGEETEEDEMLMALRIAAVCLSDMPADRPSSDELVPMLTQLHSF